MTDKVKANIEKTKARASCARFQPSRFVSDDVYQHFLSSYEQAPSFPFLVEDLEEHVERHSAEQKADSPGTPSGPQCRGARCKAIFPSLLQVKNDNTMGGREADETFAERRESVREPDEAEMQSQ